MKIPFGRPIITSEEKKIVEEVLSGPILVHGPKAVQFENDFCALTQAPYAISVSSCTAGMHLVYFALGLGSGDEVIVPAQSHVATAHAVELTGAKPVFVDAEKIYGNIDVEQLEQKITSKTRAISVVHYLGVPADMDNVNRIAKKYNLFVLEDCALAPGTYLNGKHAGLHGDVGVFSFYPIKHFTTAEGGMIITKDNVLAERLRKLKAFGVDRDHTDRAVPGMYDVNELGFNYRMSEIHAAIGIEQLKKLPEFLDLRRRNFDLLESKLNCIDGVQVIPQPNNNDIKASCYCLGLLLNPKSKVTREAIMKSLTAEGVGSSIYYPHPIPRLKYYQKKYQFNADHFSNAARISDSIIALPVGPHVSKENIEYIALVFEKIWRNLNV